MKLQQCLRILIIIICGLVLFGCHPKPPDVVVCKSYPPIITTPKGRLEFASHKVPVKQLSAAPEDPECASRAQQASKLYSQMLYWENGKTKPCMTYAELLQHKRCMLLKSLEKDGVQVEQVGETFRVILPADKLFNPCSANINRGFYCTLEDLVEWMGTYTISVVDVEGHADECCTCAMTRRQAEVVMDFLWTCGIDARLAHAVGYNGKEPIAVPNNLASKAANRRIELNFKMVPPICAIVY